MRPVKVLVVDDEPLARRRIRRLLEKRDGVEVLGECANGRIAADAIEEQEPDIVFLDIQMPERDGFQALASVQTPRPPVVVFVTAYGEHALRAFEVNALDYLLKPFDDERFDRTLDRAIRRVEERETADLRTQLIRLLDVEEKGEPGPREPAAARAHGEEPPDRIVIRDDDRLYFVKTEDIDWIEAADYQARLHTGTESHVIRESLTSLEERLDPRRFVRIHRSTIVNLDRVKELQPWFHGAYAVVLEDGTELRLSRGRRKELERRLGRSL
ncbi:MAG TPA: LytTR family DNA-binding domain-containing protein [Gemmatimonadota bacterium]|nr:LytTR family DNA-binding domain-containing protein [Gemmatimonadota bacterium]